MTSPPILSVGVECVSCQATGNYRISSSHHAALSAHCSECTAPITYSWTVTEDTGTALSLGPDDTSTGKSDDCPQASLISTGQSDDCPQLSLMILP